MVDMVPSVVNDRGESIDVYPRGKYEEGDILIGISGDNVVLTLQEANKLRDAIVFAMKMVAKYGQTP